MVKASRSEVGNVAEKIVDMLNDLYDDRKVGFVNMNDLIKWFKGYSTWLDEGGVYISLPDGIGCPEIGRHIPFKVLLESYLPGGDYDDPDHINGMAEILEKWAKKIRTHAKSLAAVAK